MSMNWHQLLSDKRISSRDPARLSPSKPEPYRTAFEADYDRIVYAAPFRRLARKTQVHPMVPHDHVRNRLTHSIEVASVGRTLARRLARFLIDRGDLPAGRGDDLCQIVQAACLAHDIGNPPFGHAGEFAIREWVRTNTTMFESIGGPLAPGVRRDWEVFEGNAQGFRLAARADNPHTGYMRLTCATLAAMIKYPWDATDDRARERGKHNVFSTERPIFESLAGEMGLHRADGSIARHPLSFLSEAADDICYRILDLEDAVDMGILDEASVRELLCRFLEQREDGHLPTAVLRGRVIRRLADACSEVFEQDYAAIMAGRRIEDLKSGMPATIVDGLGRINDHYGTIFADRPKVAAELGAYETLGRIIEMCVQAVGVLAAKRSYHATDFLTRRRLELAWGEAYAREHEQQPYAWWLHQVMDYIAGLTDNYARQLSREIAGT